MASHSRMAVDYSLYLVTDSTPAILGSGNLVHIVERAIEGGVKIVQYRDKVSDTAHLIKTAQALHQVTSKAQVPLLINDRVDVALAMGAEGVHLGQDDMDIRTARQLLGPDAIIGVSANNLEEAIAAAGADASYLGIGTVYATATKPNHKTVIGPSGVRHILSKLAAFYPHISTVAIGGINKSNVARIIYQSSPPEKPLDGVAVVSAIMAAEYPHHSARELKDLIRPQLQQLIVDAATPASPLTVDTLLAQIPRMIKQVPTHHPLSHNMTNLVVQNIAANVAICIGASPIMANNGDEARDLAALGGALVVNMGTVTPEGIENYIKAIRAYNEVGGPVVLDPVGAGATKVRRDAVKTLLDAGYFDVIKGNESEILTVASHGTNAAASESQTQQRGVDSAASNLTGTAKARIVSALAQERRTIVVMTGVTDYVSDGQRTVAIKNGHAYLGSVSGTGCVLGTTISAFVAAASAAANASGSSASPAMHPPQRGDVFTATVAAMLTFEIAAEIAATSNGVGGPGSFVPALLDKLYAFSKADEADLARRMEGAKVEVMPQ